MMGVERLALLVTVLAVAAAAAAGASFEEEGPDSGERGRGNMLAQRNLSQKCTTSSRIIHSRLEFYTL